MSAQQTWQIVVCPECRVTVLPPGAFRTRCECGCFFAREDERPDDRERTPEWWSRNGWKYAKPGLTITVVESGQRAYLEQETRA